MFDLFQIISQISVLRRFCKTCDLLSSTNSEIYNREQPERLKVIISHTSVMNLNTFLFEYASPKYLIVNEANLNLLLCMHNKYTCK